MNILATLALASVLAPEAVNLEALNSHPKVKDYRAFHQQAEVPPDLLDVSTVWSKEEDFAYFRLNDWVKLDLVQKVMSWAAPEEVSTQRMAGRGRPPRGQSFRSATSPDGQWTLQSDGFNLELKNANEGLTKRLTTDGSAESKIQYGSVSWVYGEEWGQSEAMGWSPDSRSYWFYRFDNQKVKPFYFLRQPAGATNGLDILDYPKAGDPNPAVEIYVAKPGEEPKKIFGTQEPDDAYAFRVKFMNSQQLVFQVANRDQSIRRVLSYDIKLGKTSELWKESVDNGYVPSLWDVQERGGRLFATTERNGFANWVELSFSSPAKVLTQNTMETGAMLWLSDDQLYHEMQGGANPAFKQIGKWTPGSKASAVLTDPQYSHRWAISPNGKWAIAAKQQPHGPTFVELVDLVAAQPVRTFLTSSPAPTGHLPRFIAYKAADGETDLFAELHLPADYQVGQLLPLIVETYNGPETTSPNAFSTRISNITALGFAVAKLESRGGTGRGSAFRNALWKNLGVVEIDDMAAGVKELAKQGFIDPSRVGIYGTSYGGYSTIMALLRHPEVFQVGVASSSVTDWRHYDTIYTERYMGLPQANAEVYDAGSAVKLARNLKGKLLIFAGLRDDNVHAAQTFAFLDALGRAGNYPATVFQSEAGHASVGQNATLAFFIEHLKP